MSTASVSTVVLSVLMASSLLGSCAVQEDLSADGALTGSPFPASHWRYIRVDGDRAKWGDFDEPGWLRYFGLAVGDLTGDGYGDIVSGRYFYRNPGGDLSGPWDRIDLGRNMDAILVTDVDGDAFGDLIAQALPAIYWVEAEDVLGKSWRIRRVAEVPATDHVNSQGFALGQLIPGGRPEILLAGGDGIHYLEIPSNPEAGEWPGTLVVEGASDEGFAVADVDGDGLQDLIASTAGQAIAWWRNPGSSEKGPWQRHRIGTTEPLEVDRIEAADLDGDGRVDVAVTQELVSEARPEASLYWFRQPDDARSGDWQRQRLLEAYSLNSLDAADLDGDGDTDLVTGEHKGPHLRLQLLENDGHGRFLVREIDRGKEAHLGARTADLDGDGDLEILSIAWDQHADLHLWTNLGPPSREPVCWGHISNWTGAFPAAGVAQQSSALVLDIDKDGRDDFVIAGWSPQTSMVWFRSGPSGPERYLIDDRQSHIEAGGDWFDLDGDGDPDIVQGGSWNTNQVWWWENPYPDFAPSEPWARHSIKNWGEKQHHDQIIGDFDGDGAPELVFWNQQAGKLFLADIPDDPRDPSGWSPLAIWSWSPGSDHEGLARADVDLDGKLDLIGGGYWFKHLGDRRFQANAVDADYGFSRTAVGDFIEGGRPEILLGSGDGQGPLNLYEWHEGTWRRSTLILDLNHGHSLQVGDVDADGHLDIYVAEMHTPGAGAAARQMLLYGDGRGGFVRQLISTGIGTHEGKLGDLDGDGDLDILQKDFQHQGRIDLWINQRGAGCGGA